MNQVNKSVVPPYFKERFPIAGVALVSAGFGFFAVGILPNRHLSYLISMASLFTVWFIALLLRQRITDEFKDYSHDSKYYPNRPYQRGTTTKQTLLLLGALAIVIEGICAVWISPHAFIWYLFVVVYSLLVAKEFFAPTWLNKNTT